MAGIQNFRTALGGFNRNDVVNYIEFLNNQHNAQIAQLNTQLQNAQEALAKAQAIPQSHSELLAQLEAAQARCVELEAALAAKGAPTDSELEAYRRAERVERMAQERAAQIHDKANAVLADATVKVEAAADGIKTAAAQVAEQIQCAEKQLQDAVSAMYAIRPEDK
jgi:chromosome segregation ATPase